MIRKSLMLAAVAGGLGLAGVNGLAHAAPSGAPPHGPHDHHGMGGPGMFMMMPMLSGVTLTPDQEKQIHEIMKSGRHDGHESWDKMKSLHEQVEATLFAPGKVDQAKLTSLTQQIDAMHAQEDADRMAVAVKVHDILTPEQLALAQQNNAKIESLQQQLGELMRPPHDHGDHDSGD